MKATAAVVREKEQAFSVEEVEIDGPRAAALRRAVDALAPLGTCGVVGAPPVGTEVSLDWNGVMIGYHDLDEINKAAEDAEGGGTLKSVLRTS